jgi:hypothetical protein
MSPTENNLETLKQELREGLMEAKSFAGLCQMLVGDELEAEAQDLQVAAEALHAAALARVPTQRTTEP